MKALEQFRQKLESEKSAREAAWSALVSKLTSDRKIADKVSAKDIADVLEAAGKTVDDLERAVATEKRCVERRERAKDRPAALKRLQTAEHHKAEYHARRQRQWAELQVEDKRIHGEAFAARGQLGNIDAAIRELESLTGASFVWADSEDAAA